MADVDQQKRIRAIRKKLTQIEKLKSRNDPLTAEEAQKVASEPQLLAEVAALERGEEYDPSPPPVPEPAPVEEVQAAAPVVEEQAPAAQDDSAAQGEEAPAEPPEPKHQVNLDIPPEEAEKRIKALNKKLGQIARLKEKASLSPEESDKVSSEASLQSEMNELAISLLDPEAQKSAKALQKKLSQIAMMKGRKDKSTLTQQEREKMNKGPALKQEFEALLASRPTYKPPPVHNDAKDNTAPKKGDAHPAAAASQASPTQFVGNNIVEEDGFMQKASKKTKQKAKAAAAE